MECNFLNLPVLDIIQQLREARQTLKEYQQNHIALHEEYLRESGEAQKEAQQTMHSGINRALHPGDWFRGLQSVDIPESDTLTPYPESPDPKTWSGPWHTISDQC